MIEALLAVNFGKFAHASFPLAKCTVFFGGNEAGKTTLFDALLKALCRPSGATKLGKELNARYGANAEARLQLGPQADEPSVDVGDFLGLHAVRSGDVRFGADSGGHDWAVELKARLFASGIDLGAVAAGLARQATEDPRTKHVKEMRRLEEARQSTVRRLEGLRAKRAQVAEMERRAAALGGECVRLAARGAETKERLAQLETRLAEDRRARDRAELDRLWHSLSTLEADLRALRELEPYRDDETAALDVLSRQVASQREEANACRLRRHDLGENLGPLADEVTRVELHAEEKKALAERAVALKARLQRYRDQPAMSSRTTWRPWTLAVALGLAVAIVPASIFLPAEMKLSVTIGALALAAVVAVLGRHTKVEIDRQAEARFAIELAQEWNVRAPTGFVVEAHSTAVLESICDAVITDFESLKERLRLRRDALRHTENEEMAAQRRLGEAQEALVAVEAHELAWLRVKGVTSREQYLAQLGRRRELEQRCELRGRELGLALSESALVSYRADLEKRLIASPPAGASLLPEAEHADLERQAKQMAAELESVTKSLAAHESEHNACAGEIRGTLRGLAEEMATVEAEVCQLDLERSSWHLRRQAAGIAAELFAELDRDDASQLQGLAAELESSLALMLGTHARLELTELCEAGAGVQDAGGVLRAAEHLSRGTRDAFALAARLGLAERLDATLPLLVFDEPFLSLDAVRLERAVSLVRRLHERKGWQIVFFTKEQPLRDELARAFPDLLVHDLGRPPPS
jgi:DNA repair exonuclease SbcCD ATPase subunit